MKSIKVLNKKKEIFIRLSTVFILAIVFCLNIGSKRIITPIVDKKFFNEKINYKWAKAELKKLTEEEKIAQLFMISVREKKGEEYLDSIAELIENYNIGGLIIFQGAPYSYAKLLNRFQSIAKTPLMVGIDAEWGLAMRLDSTIKFPYQMTLGAIKNDTLIYEMGKDIAYQCRRMGVHINFAPVMDINNNSANPVINSRSFGENKETVAKLGLAYMRGLQDNGVLANAKHFPGHGDTNSDSHKTLPIINHSKERLDSVELYPFKSLIKEGLGSMMIAHLYIPKLDSTPNLASTLSKPIVTGLLKEELKFDGLIFTDALNMKGVSKYYKPGIVDVKALLAGNDVLLYPENVPKAIEEIKKAISNNEISWKEIDERVLKILKAKQILRLNENTEVDLSNITKDLNNKKSKALQQKLFESSLTILKNDQNIIPLKNIENLKIATVAIGGSPNNIFQTMLRKYGAVSRYYIPTAFSKIKKDKLRIQLKKFDLVIVSLHGTKRSPAKNFGLTTASLNFVKDLLKEKNVILNVFGSPYILDKIEKLDKAKAIILSHEDLNVTKKLSAQLIFGGIPAKGRLPVSVAGFKEGHGIIIDSAIRMKYTIPEDVGINSSYLFKIDSIAQNGIFEQAYPGCQIFIAKKGKVFYNKSFGYHTYDSLLPVQNTDIYDLASITKIVASTATLMKLEDGSELSVDLSLCDYLSDWVDTSTYYQNVNLREMLAHQAGFSSWIPFYVSSLHGGYPRYDIYSNKRNSIYNIRVAENFYMRASYRDSMFNQLLCTPVKEEKKYVYSDLGYYFIPEIVKRKTGLTLDKYIDIHFTKKLGLQTFGYLPRKKFGLNRIIPTEDDKIFRRQLIHGDVHDPGAAMLGGVGGHAGVFSNAEDLGIFMQMLLNWGSYGGNRFFSEEIVKDFTSSHFLENENRRGVGFDKPVRDDDGGPTCNCVSYDSFGHTGFTGTMAWADPGEEIIYIFLSNRVYPSASNWKLIKLDIRTKIQQAIYDAIRQSREDLTS